MAIYAQNLELAAEIIKLKGLLELKDKEIKMWAERGNRAWVTRDDALDRLKQLQELFVKIMGSEVEFNAYKEGVKDSVRNQ